jgi:formylglycine-generating enzyme required for sulfatase activity
VAALLAAMGTGACAKRAQLLIVVDTDAPLATQLLTDASLAPEAVIDTVRIDTFDESWQPVCIDQVDCTASYVLPDPSLWPFSFGIATPPGGSSVLHLRVRAFRGAVASPGYETIDGGSTPTLDVPQQAAIDRLIEITLPSSGETIARVFLAEDCLARPVFFLGPTTCIDGSTPSGAPGAAIDYLGAAPALGSSSAGTWSRAHEAPCVAASPPGGNDAICVPGGLSYLGEADLAGADQQSDVAAAPPVPVYVRPFWMDRTELTVGRFRALVNKGLSIIPGADPIPPDASNMNTAACTWLGSADASHDDYPVNCVSWGLARRACQLSGGDLPSEAQWEHAARGRGQERIFPWGNQSPTCCTTAAGIGTECPGAGPQKVGSYPPSACNGVGDQSRDRILDLGGNVSEFCADLLVTYGTGCWGVGGILGDTPCQDTSTDAHARRGGNWNSGSANARSAFRHTDTQSVLDGFRCVYPDGAP